VDRDALAGLSLPPKVPCGVIAVSGAPFDIADDESYALGTDPARYEKPFRAGDVTDAWKREASAVNFITPAAPSFLLLQGRRDPKGLQRQNRLMFDALVAAGVPSRRVLTPRDGHFTIVAALSYPGSEASSAVLEFIENTRCSSDDALLQ
jgi:hypothetical protein